MMYKQIKALPIHCGVPFWIDVAVRLRDKHGWIFPYFIAPEHMRRKIADEFPDAIFHLKLLTKTGEYENICNLADIRPSPLDKEILNRLASYESIYLKMMDRHNFDKSFTFHKRLMSYHTGLMYWKSVLEKWKFDVVVFKTVPHIGYDFLIYILCELLKINKVIIERIGIPGYLACSSSYEIGPEEIYNCYFDLIKNGNNVRNTISEDTMQYLKRLESDYKTAMPFHLKFKMKNKPKSGNLPSNIEVVKSVSKYILRGVSINCKPVFYKKQIYSLLGNLKRKKLLKYYQKISKDVNLNCKFIFVALQCEPERQTCPSGDVFGIQYLMVDMLSKKVPKGWKLYVKEHVSQFKSYQKAEMSKSFTFYDVIRKMKNVEFVPIEINSFELIDHAMATATVSGTAGWESVARGRPSLLFGHSWYKKCEGVFDIKTIESLETALSKIANKDTIDRDKILTYVAAIEKVAIRGYIDRIYQKHCNISESDNVRIISDEIYRFYSCNANSSKRFIINQTTCRE